MALAMTMTLHEIRELSSKPGGKIIDSKIFGAIKATGVSESYTKGYGERYGGENLFKNFNENFSAAKTTIVGEDIAVRERYSDTREIR